MKKLTKFFMACGVAFVVGMIMFAVGLGTGGVEGYDKVAAEHDWVSGSPGDRVASITRDLEFDSIEATGVMDVVIAGETHYNAVISEYNIDLDEAPEPGTAVVLHGENVEAPSLTEAGKTLKIQGGNGEFTGVNLDFSSTDSYPTVILFCAGDELDSIKASAAYSDIWLAGISFKSADIQLNFGDVNGKDIKSKGLNIYNEMGDVELSGDLKGTTSIKINEGDIELDVQQAIEDYTVDAVANEGDITINRGETEYGKKFNQDGGKDVLKLTVNFGDISIDKLEDPDSVTL